MTFQRQNLKKSVVLYVKEQNSVNFTKYIYVRLQPYQ